jgi:hypothetical protein
MTVLRFELKQDNSKAKDLTLQNLGENLRGLFGAIPVLVGLPKVEGHSRTPL